MRLISFHFPLFPYVEIQSFTAIDARGSEGRQITEYLFEVFSRLNALFKEGMSLTDLKEGQFQFPHRIGLSTQYYSPDKGTVLMRYRLEHDHQKPPREHIELFWEALSTPIYLSKNRLTEIDIHPGKAIVTHYAIDLDGDQKHLNTDVWIASSKNRYPLPSGDFIDRSGDIAALYRYIANWRFLDCAHIDSVSEFNDLRREAQASTLFVADLGSRMDAEEIGKLTYDLKNDLIPEQVLFSTTSEIFLRTLPPWTVIEPSEITKHLSRYRQR